MAEVSIVIIGSFSFLVRKQIRHLTTVEHLTFTEGEVLARLPFREPEALCTSPRIPIWWRVFKASFFWMGRSSRVNGYSLSNIDSLLPLIIRQHLFKLRLPGRVTSTCSFN